jgi:hypothetical protein
MRISRGSNKWPNPNNEKRCRKAMIIENLSVREGNEKLFWGEVKQ